VALISISPIRRAFALFHRQRSLALASAARPVGPPSASASEPSLFAPDELYQHRAPPSRILFIPRLPASWLLDDGLGVDEALPTARHAGLAPPLADVRPANSGPSSWCRVSRPVCGLLHRSCVGPPDVGQPYWVWETPRADLRILVLFPDVLGWSRPLWAAPNR